MATISLFASLAWGQRVQFPSMVSDGSGTVSATPVQAPGPVVQPGAAGWDPYADPSMQPPNLYSAPAPYAPGAAPYGQPGYAPAPYSPTPGSLFPEGGPQLGVPDTSWFPQPIRQGTRLFQELRFEGTWLAPIGGNEGKLGVSDLETSATLAFPFFYNQTPLLVTPGFAVHYWDGPVTLPPLFADMPPRTYDAYLDFAWAPQVTPWFGAELGFRTGVYSDFDHVNNDSLRFIGGGLAVFTFTPTTQVKVGAIYVDRLDVKLLPAGGIVWTPNSDARYEIIFPRPKLARRLTTIGNTDLWGYVAGEWGGGTWTIERLDGSPDQVEYDDIRVQLGLDWETLSNIKGMFEVAYVFNRKLKYRSELPPEFEPNDTVELRTGIAF